MDDVPTAQVLHPPGHVQHELQQRLQGQVLGWGAATVRAKSLQWDSELITAEELLSSQDLQTGALPVWTAAGTCAGHRAS